MVQVVLRSALLVIGLSVALGAALAQDRRQNKPGEFDFYVLSLSWSPSFCEASGERARGREQKADLQCGPRPFSFVVHGLWPQYEKGFPEFCQQPAPRLDRNIVSGRPLCHGWTSNRDPRPSSTSPFGECRQSRNRRVISASCFAYFEIIRKARAAVKIPENYLELSRPLTVTPDEVEEAFVTANPGLSRAGIAVTCDARRLQEVRICLSKDLKFRNCGQSERRLCRRDQLVMPPLRG